MAYLHYDDKEREYMTEMKNAQIGGSPEPPKPEGTEHVEHVEQTSAASVQNASATVSPAAADTTTPVPPATPTAPSATTPLPHQTMPQYSSAPTGPTPPVVNPQHVHSHEKKSGTGKTFWLGFAGAAVACAVGLGCFGIWQANVGNAPATNSQSPLISQDNSSSATITQEPETLPEEVAHKCLPSVVAIDVYTDTSAGMGMFGASSDSGELVASSLGSGVVLTEDGYIVTNNHVVEGADAVTVTVEGVQYEADVVGTDPSSDLAVVKARDASGLTPMDIGDSDDLIIGEWVMSIGSPFGLEQSVATGIVSATSRSQIMPASTDQYGNATGQASVYANMIQTDAAINPGNSGGALVNSEGALIGINTLITSYSGNYSGVGFAIPVNYAVNIAQQIMDGKTPTHAQLGVSLSTVTPQLAQRYGLAVDSGAYIAAVSPDSGAAAAGLEAGDIVTKFDDRDVASADDLMLDVRGQNPGDTVVLQVNRNGEVSDVEVTLGSDEASQQAAQQQQQQGNGSGGLFGNR